MTRPVNVAGLKLIKDSEGLELKPYMCPAGWWTVGYGHVLRKNDRPLRYEMDRAYAMDQFKRRFQWGMDEKDAEKLLQEDLVRFTEGLEDLVTVPLNENQFSALASLVFNIGLGRRDGVKGDFADSTLLRYLNEGNYERAADCFLQWDKARISGIYQSLPGLTKRRKAERALFLTPC